MTAEGVRAEPARTARMRGPGVPHAPGLDGLRGLAVLAVLAYHLDLAWASGGFLGVEVFFTLSGFLITQLLVADVRRTGTVDVGAFLRARARRLLPALVTCVTATVVTYRLMLPDDAPGLRWDALASLAYVQNWQLMLGGMPYSEAFARPSPLLHLWSLSVEGQLYVLWPMLFVGVLAVQRRASVVAVALGLAVVSAVVLAVGYTPDGGELIYYATPARASGFLVGAALAVAWRPEAWSRPLPRVVDAVLDCAGLVAVVTVVLAFVTASEFDAALFDRGGFLRTGLASAVVILAATRQGIVATVLSGPLLSGAGRRSYGLYLYHWPVFVLCRDVAVPEWLRITLCLALTYTITEVSYCWMEIPVRRGGLRTAARVLRLPRPAATGALAAATAAVVTVVVASTGVPTGLDGDPVTDGPTALAAPVAVSVAASGPDGAESAPAAAGPGAERPLPRCRRPGIRRVPVRAPASSWATRSRSAAPAHCVPCSAVPRPWTRRWAASSPPRRRSSRRGRGHTAARSSSRSAPTARSPAATSTPCSPPPARGASSSSGSRSPGDGGTGTTPCSAPPPHVPRRWRSWTGPRWSRPTRARSARTACIPGPGDGRCWPGPSPTRSADDPVAIRGL